MHPIAIAVVRSLIPQGGTPLIHEMCSRVLQVPHLTPAGIDYYQKALKSVE
jgi:hypothetical protein